MIEWIKKIDYTLAGWFEWIGVAGLLAMMIITVIDILGGKIFLWPFPGVTDTVGICQLAAMAFAVGMTQMLGKHIELEFFVTKLSGRIEATVATIIALLTLGLFMLLIWQSFKLGYYFQIGGERTPAVGIPRAPLAYALAIACIPICLVFLRKLLNSLFRIARG